MKGQANTDKTALNRLRGHKKDKCQSSLFGTVPYEKEILVDYAQHRINRSRNRLSA
jgi:hypothetical protein